MITIPKLLIVCVVLTIVAGIGYYRATKKLSELKQELDKQPKDE